MRYNEGLLTTLPEPGELPGVMRGFFGQRLKSSTSRFSDKDLIASSMLDGLSLNREASGGVPGRAPTMTTNRPIAPAPPPPNEKPPDIS